MARAGPGHDQGRARGRCPARDVSDPRGHGRAGAVGTTWGGHTRELDDTAAWLALQCSKTAVTALLRVTWRTVGNMVARVGAEIDATVDRLDGLRRIGIDEISYKRGHRYLTVVVDHDSGRLVWAQPGRDKATVRAFFDQLGGPDRARSPTYRQMGPIGSLRWSPSGARMRCCARIRFTWCVGHRCARRGPSRGVERGPRGRHPAACRPSTGKARLLKHARYALWKNPENLTIRQREKLAWVAKTDPRLHRAYLLKEGLRLVFHLKGQAGKEALDRWIAWAQRCRIPSFVDLQRRIRKHRAAIDATLDQACPKDSSSPPTPRSACSPESPTGSNPPTHSSPWPCSPSAATALHSPDGHEPTHGSGRRTRILPKQVRLPQRSARPRTRLAAHG